jgi:hypothetical protein
VFTDPQSVTRNSVAISLAKTKVGDLNSFYQSADGNYTLTISHQETNAQRVRTLVKLTERKVVTDPLSTANDYDTCQFQLTIDRPLVGWSATEIGYMVTALTGLVNGTGVVAKLYGEES